MDKTFIKPKSKFWDNVRFSGLVLLVLSTFFIVVEKVSLLAQSQETIVITKPNVITELGGFEIGSSLHRYSDKLTRKLDEANRYQYEDITVSVNFNNKIIQVIEVKERQASDRGSVELLFTQLKRETLKQLGLKDIDLELWGINGKATLVNGNISLEIGYKKNLAIKSDKAILYAIVKDLTAKNHY
jgi:hypothetical protein